MKLRSMLLPIAAIGLVAAPVLAAEPRASIPFANSGGVNDWRAEGDRTIYFQDNHRQWYRAELFAPAYDLPFTERIGIDSGPTGTLDKWGAIYVRGQRYPFASFQQVSGPPAKHVKQAEKASAKGA